MFQKADHLDDVVLDLDDFAMNPENSGPCMYHLREMKRKYPNFKVTLFAIPFYGGVDNTAFFKEVTKEWPWVQMAIHGWDHATSMECAEWKYEEAEEKILKAYDTGAFVKVFKAPGWQISRETYMALYKHGFTVADHNESVYVEKGILNKDRRPSSLKAYTVDHPWMVHGHTWDMSNPDPIYRNGIRQIIEEHGVPWDENTNFHFITEV